MNHYVYKITNRTTGEYYYGKRSCSSDWRDDSYMGSGTLLKAKMNAHADDDWHKEVLLLLDSEEEAFEYETICIGDRWDSDPLCLNLRPGGEGMSSEAMIRKWEDPAFRAKVQAGMAQVDQEALNERRSQSISAKYADPEYKAKHQASLETPEYRRLRSKTTAALWEQEGYRDRLKAKHNEPEQRALYSDIRASRCLDKETVLLREGEAISVPRKDVIPYLKCGWTLKSRIGCHHPEHKVWVHPRPDTLTMLLASDTGWEVGSRNNTMRKVSVKEAKRLSGLT